MSPPTTTTFSKPPPDVAISLADAYEFNGKHNADHPMVRWYSEEAGLEQRLWGEGIKAFRNTAVNVLDALGPGKEQVVGVLATTGQIRFWDLLAGLILSGYVPFVISPRNSTQAVEWLLETEKATQLVASDDKLEFSRPISDKLSIGLHRVEDLLKDAAGREPTLPPRDHVTRDSPSLIIHSSGSTAFPKPIHFNHRVVRQWAWAPEQSDFDLDGRVVGAYPLPMFHGMGLIVTFFSTFIGAIPTFPPPNELPTVPTPDKVLAQELSMKAEFIFAVPSFLETWSESPEAVKGLAQFEVVAYGGGPLEASAGNALVKAGVPLVNTYGLSEVGSISKFWSKPRQEEWQYWEMLPSFTPLLIPIEGMHETYRIVAKQTEKHVLSRSNLTLEDGTLAYDSNDIIERHPTKPTLWKTVGRYDDQIMHSTGEKTNPGPLEGILRRSTYIQEAVMFGRSRFHAGVIISPTDQGKDLSRLELLKAIWPEVEAANDYAPTHSRIFPEMIIIEKPEKPFEYTAKSTPRRSAIVDTYEPEINATYEAFEDTNANGAAAAATASNGDLASKAGTYDDMLRFVRDTVKPNIPNDVNDNDDVFRAGGGDSLAATRIRNSLLKTQVYSAAIPSDFVYTMPTIAKMAAFLYGINIVTNVMAGNKSETEVPDVPDPNATVVRFREAAEGQVPLIMLHGGGGTIYDLWLMKGKFTTGFWAIQVTPDTPLQTLQAQSDFYYQKIREQQPHGPYRIGGYSGSTILAIRIAILLEAAGETVTQLALVDQFPTMFIEPSLPIHDRRAYAEHSIHRLADMFRRDSLPRRLKLADEMVDAFYGKPSTELGQMLADMFPVTAGLILDFIAGLKEKDDEDMMVALVRWMKQVKAPVGLYAAKEGSQIILPQTEEWKDMGVRQVYPDADVVTVEGNHFNIVSNETVCAHLQKGYL